jgi:hypothetical protein
MMRMLAAAIAGTATLSLAAPALAGASHATPTTVTFTTVSHLQRKLSTTTESFVGTDTTSTGKLRGLFEIHQTQAKRTIVNAAFSFSGGMLFANAVSTSSGTDKGKVTGGTGSFAGATGTIQLVPGTGPGNFTVTLVYS